MASTLPTPASECCNTACTCCTDATIESLIEQAVGNIEDGYGTNALLKAATGYVDGSVAHVFGIATRGDSVMRVYYFDSVSVLADNGMSVLIPDNITHPAPGRWLQTL